MLYSLRGKLIHKENTLFAVECRGVGYKCFSTMTTISKLPQKNEEVFVYTHLNVREDAMDLYGFYEIGELNCFKQLISVSGIGPKGALAILSAMTPETFALCVASNDVKALTKVSGIGAKTAQRVILELKDKIKDSDVVEGFTKQSPVMPASSPNMAEAVSALVVLGYSNTEAAGALSGCSPDDSVENMIRVGLKNLAKRR